jgi:hypothetical protein
MSICNLVIIVSLIKIYTMKYLILPLLLVLLVSSCKKEEGCTDPTAINYNADAEKDDGSCAYTTGCTDADAINTDPDAVNDDGSCLYMCTDSQASNYSDTITEPVCEYETSIVIWLEATASEYFDSVGVSTLEIRAGGDLIPKLMVPTEEFFTGLDAQDMLLCTDTNPEPIHYVYQWENTQATTVTLVVSDLNLNIMYQSIESVLANGCTTLQLTRDKIEAWQDSQ